MNERREKVLFWENKVQNGYILYKMSEKYIYSYQNVDFISHEFNCFLIFQSGVLRVFYFP